MTIGLSTYAYFWQGSDQVEKPLNLSDMIAATADAGVGVFQICDYPAVEHLDREQLQALRSQADRAGIRLELGTRGVGTEHLTSYLALARQLDAITVRSMLYSATHRPTVDNAKTLLQQVIPAFEAAGVTLALETYEQVPSAVLVDLVSGIDSPSLGICSDPANCVAALELPVDVIDRVAPYVVNMHIKDFQFTRQEGWVGFTLVGAPLGEGLLDYDAMIERVNPLPRNISQIIEHWLPWQGSADDTCAMEQQWTEHNLSYLRSKQS
jgi:sugar phosphate isomerase/epimerase